MIEKILNKIEEYECICLYRHVNPDYDAFGSQFGMYDLIQNTFENKEVYFAGDFSSDLVAKYQFNGEINEPNFEKPTLGIVLDTANQERIDGDISLCKEIIKILCFTKMEGIGNDYIYVDGIHQEVPMDAEFISRISNRHFGIGGDGMIVILKSDQYDFKMRMFNLDGSEGMMCGNGIRCFAKFCYDHHLTDKKVLNIETKAGLRIVELIFDGDEVVGAKVDMQEPILNCKDIPVIFDQEKMINEKVMIGDQEYALTAVSMGNPHVITYVDSLDFDIETIGKQFEHHQIFPESVNTEFVEVINDHYLKMRVWERGSGETMACGTGACAVMYASYLNGYCKEKATVELLGGKLDIELQEGHIFMTGPATTVFEGKIRI